ARMAAAFSLLPGIDEELATDWSSRDSYLFSLEKDAVLLNERNDLFFYRFADGKAHRLTADPATEEGETLSPDGRLAAYVSGFNLYVVDTAGGPPRALTAEGSRTHLLGRLDWVYQEEIYGRGDWQAYWWSPDSRRLVFLALDESKVPETTIVDHRETHPEVEHWRYPKAGDPNPSVRVGVADVAGGDIRWIDLSSYGTQEILVVRAGWTPDSKQVVLQIQNRIQTWLDLLVADPKTGESKRLFRDSTGVWIEPTDAPFFSADGEQFLWLSERSGFRHLYLYNRDGTLVRPLTSGPFEVDLVHGISKKDRTVFFSGDRDDVKGQKLFRVSLEGGEPELLTPKDGTHAVSISPDCFFFLDTFSSLNNPGWVALHQGDGKLLRVLGEGSTAAIEEYHLPVPEFVKVKTRDGFSMEAMMIRPPGFDPAVRYPVFCYTYSGPHTPSVEDRFNSRSGLWYRLLAQRGFLVWICDNRSASGRGLESVQGIYRNLGAQELADLEDGIDWLIAQGSADPERIGLFGWSYGGFMTSYALTHSKKFKLGIVGAPVTDWRLYDSVYTERYMDTPANNPEGYATSSVVKAAANLSGRMLLIHGMIDENVHIENSAQFIEALQKAGKRFDLMVYPGNRHGARDEKQRLHLYEMMTTFVEEHL
ncbi:MAG: S9 family peptidase, partial [Planctomycetota bacterium]